MYYLNEKQVHLWSLVKSKKALNILSLILCFNSSTAESLDVKSLSVFWAKAC